VFEALGIGRDGATPGTGGRGKGRAATGTIGAGLWGSGGRDAGTLVANIFAASPGFPVPDSVLRGAGGRGGSRVMIKSPNSL
jgi:hypothetical protein